MEQQSKVISAISYLSIFFAPFLLPLILYFVTKDQEVKFHAKRALISHSIPTILGLFYGVLIIVFSFTASMDNGDFIFISIIISTLIYFAITIIITAWNIFQAVRVFRRELIS
ncbi:hypothetical protein JOD29_001430 [Lysinibacillus composti]|uniref:DUF4870 domain-containing protein n=1 Tax=Lysinibacillus composti TaxID=720633 RepID=A0A3N9UGM2_9BACI|nr:DUF4870 domain-containing protein [Lysinibacillus composti]MBM7608186.1 hypothetical protein [Lysinibacillus composti]RQW75250.1 DUF4870 domain-containing protein [Lysinibacillus composti]